MGITQKPIRARFTENRATFSDYKVQKAKAIKPQAHVEITLRVSLYLAYLSSRIPKKKDPQTPKKMKVAPKILLSTEV